MNKPDGVVQEIWDECERLSTEAFYGEGRVVWGDYYNTDDEALTSMFYNAILKARQDALEECMKVAQDSKYPPPYADNSYEDCFNEGCAQVWMDIRALSQPQKAEQE